MDINEILEIIKEAAYEVRLQLAPGYMESVYQNALIRELRSHGLTAEKEVPIPVRYKNYIVGDFRADILVNNSVTHLYTLVYQGFRRIPACLVPNF